MSEDQEMTDRGLEQAREDDAAGITEQSEEVVDAVEKPVAIQDQPETNTMLSVMRTGDMKYKMQKNHKYKNCHKEFEGANILVEAGKVFSKRSSHSRSRSEFVVMKYLHILFKHAADNIPIKYVKGDIEAITAGPHATGPLKELLGSEAGDYTITPWEDLDARFVLPDPCQVITKGGMLTVGWYYPSYGHIGGYDVTDIEKIRYLIPKEREESYLEGEKMRKDILAKEEAEYKAKRAIPPFELPGDDGIPPLSEDFDGDPPYFYDRKTLEFLAGDEEKYKADLEEWLNTEDGKVFSSSLEKDLERFTEDAFGDASKLPFKYDVVDGAPVFVSGDEEAFNNVKDKLHLAIGEDEPAPDVEETTA